MIYSKEKIEKKYVVGLSVRTSNAQFHKEGVPLKMRFHEERCFERIPNRLNDTVFAVYYDYEGDYTQPFDYLVGCEVSDLSAISKDMVGLEIPSATYAVFTADGPFPQSLVEAWQAIWNSNLKRTYSYDFEIYGADFHPQHNPQVKICIGIEP